MKTYIVKSSHDVYKDDYEQGETDHVNWYSLDATIKAENPQKAIEKYFENSLYYKFDIKCSQIDELLHYSVLVDEENSEATENEIELWKQGKKQLFVNNIVISVYELVEVKLT